MKALMLSGKTQQRHLGMRLGNDCTNATSAIDSLRNQVTSSNTFVHTLVRTWFSSLAEIHG